MLRAVQKFHFGRSIVGFFRNQTKLLQNGQELTKLWPFKNWYFLWSFKQNQVRFFRGLYFSTP